VNALSSGGCELTAALRFVFGRNILRVEPMDDFSQLMPLQLLAVHARITDELRSRGITRSVNNPTGDLAEYLFCKAFGWKQAENSNSNVDAIGLDQLRYQIKGRRMTRHNNSRQLSALRDLRDARFDFLAGVLFAEDYSVNACRDHPLCRCA